MPPQVTIRSLFDRHYFDLLVAMTAKEFTVRYKQTFFGFLWIIINPLLQMLIIGTIFSNFVDIPNYFIFLFSGLLPWQFFSLTLAKTTSCFVNERYLLQKAAISREIIPLSIMLSNAINFLLSLGLFIGVIKILVPANSIEYSVLLLAIIWLVLFTGGLSLLTSSLNVRFRDVSFFVQTLILLWFYATPILYSIHQLPLQLQQTMTYNPLAAPISLIQSSLLAQLPPSPELVISNMLLSAAIIGMGLVVFIKQSPYFSDWL